MFFFAVLHYFHITAQFCSEMDLCPVGSWWPGWTLIHIGFCALLTSAMLSQQASPPQSLLLDMFICMMNTQFFGHSWLHFVFLIVRWSWCGEQDEKCRANSFKSSCSSLHKEEQDSPLSWWGCSLRKFILYCVQHNFTLLPFMMYLLVT